MKKAKNTNTKNKTNTNTNTKDKYYYTQAEVYTLLKKHKIPIEDFGNFIHGQGCPVVNGDLCYFMWDVDRFIGCWKYERKK